MQPSTNGKFQTDPESMSISRWPDWKDYVRNVVIYALALGSLLMTSRGFCESVSLAWDYPTNELNGVTFRLKWTTNVALTNWVTIATTTNTTVRVDVPKGVNFFACTASNFWGESFFSNIASTPPVVRTNVSLNISRP